MKGRAKQNGCCLANFLCHFRVLLSGVWPAKDWKRWELRGQLLAGRFRFLFLEVEADLEYLCNYLGPTMAGK